MYFHKLLLISNTWSKLDMTYKKCSIRSLSNAHYEQQLYDTDWWLRFWHHMVLDLMLIQLIITMELHHCSHSWSVSCPIPPTAWTRAWVTSPWLLWAMPLLMVGGGGGGASLWTGWDEGLCSYPCGVMKRKGGDVWQFLFGSVWQPVDNQCLFWTWAISVSAVENRASDCSQRFNCRWTLSCCRRRRWQGKDFVQSLSKNEKLNGSWCIYSN